MIGEYIPSGQGTVDTIRLQDGRTIQVSAVDGESPYIVARGNPHSHCVHARSNGDFPWRWGWGYAVLGIGLTVAVGIPYGIGYAVGSAKFKNK